MIFPNNENKLLKSENLYVLTEENIISSLNFETGKVIWRRISPDTFSFFASNGNLFTITKSKEIFAWNEMGNLNWNQILPSNSSEFIDYTSKGNNLFLLFENQMVVVDTTNGDFKISSINSLGVGFKKEIGEISVVELKKPSNKFIISKIGQNDKLEAETEVKFENSNVGEDDKVFLSENEIVIFKRTTSTFYFEKSAPIQTKETILNEKEIIYYDESSNLIHYGAKGYFKPKINFSAPIKRAFKGECKNNSCKFVASLKDDTILLIRDDQHFTTRDEGLASIIQTEMIDVESEKKRENVQISFSQRLSLQLNWIKNFFSFSNEKSTSDRLGFDKILLLLSKSGNLYGISSLNGLILWTKYYDGLNKIHLFNKKIYGVRKNSICELDIHGEILSEHNVEEIEKSYTTKYGVVLLSKEGYSVYPSGSNYKLNTYRVEGNDVSGFLLKDGKEELIWRMSFNSTIVSHQRVSQSDVYSQVKVFGDFTTHIKKLNLNMFALATSDFTSTKPVLTIYLIDGEKGLVIDSFTHINARGPVHMVLDESFLLYHFENTKLKKFQITVHELFFENRYTQSFILPSSVKTISTTKTNKGITSKLFLFGLSSDKIIGLPKTALDPRRPLGPPSASDQEEFLNTYEQELPLIGTSFVTYNQTILNLKHIDTFPSKLESSSHVLAYGTDVFYTRVAPSLSFDYLNDDFSYSLLLATSFGLLCVTLVARWYSRQVEIQRKWA